MTPAALTSLIHQELVSQRCVLLSRCFEHLGRCDRLEDAPGFAAWKQFLEASRDQLVSEIQSADETLFNNSGSNDSPSDLARLQEQGEALGEALLAWPEICQVAATLS
jgi:hypothetical protein